jgi:hypothetical protein
VGSSSSWVCLVCDGPCGPYCFCQQSHAKVARFSTEKDVRTFLVPSFCTGPLGIPPSLLPPTHCLYHIPLGRKSLASAILVQVLPGDISMALLSCGGFLHCVLLVGFQLLGAIGGLFLFFELVNPILHVDVYVLLVNHSCPPLFIVCGGGMFQRIHSYITLGRALVKICRTRF